jgi:hypothetical protein
VTGGKLRLFGGSVSTNSQSSPFLRSLNWWLKTLSARWPIPHVRTGVLHVSDKKRGRPATARGAYNPIPCRSLGRVSDADWQTLQAAAEAAGQTFTSWAVTTLLRKAKRG